MNPFQLDVVDNTHELQIQNIDRETIEQEDTMSMIGSYIEKMDSELINQQQIKSIFQELYLEALSECDE
jgi:hypothetical protein